MANAQAQSDQTGLKLLAYTDCNALERMEKWRVSGGTLNNNRNIGCGINTLTFLGVFDRATGQRMVDALASDPATTGTSFLDIMRYVARHSDAQIPPGSVINELAGYIHTVDLLMDFATWVYDNLPMNACTIIKMNRDLAGEMPGHSFILTKDADGVLHAVDPQTMHVRVLKVWEDIEAFSRFVTRNQFLTASVIVYRAARLKPGAAAPLIVPRGEQPARRRRVRVPPRTRTGAVREDPPLPRIAVPDKDIRDLASAGSLRSKGVSVESQTGPPLVLDSMATLADLDADRLLVLKHMPDERLMVRRQYSPLAPILTVPFSAKQADDWIQELCTTDTACVNHAMSILRVLPREQYRELVRQQNETAAGMSSREIEGLLRQAAPRVRFVQNQTFDVSTEADWRALFARIPVGEGTIGKLYRGGNAMGHVVVLANMLPGSDQIPAGPVLLDGTMRKWFQISHIATYLKEHKLLPVVGLVLHPPRIEYRGTKRKRRLIAKSKSRSRSKSKSKGSSRLSPPKKRRKSKSKTSLPPRPAAFRLSKPVAFHVGAAVVGNVKPATRKRKTRSRMAATRASTRRKQAPAPLAEPMIVE